MTDLTGKRVVVTGGAGFLGSFVVDVLRARGVRDVIVPRRRDYDLVDRAACARLVRDHRPDLVFHLAARVGGIGANRDNPGLFLFDNAMMGLQLLEECRLGGVAKVVVAGTICAYPKHAAVPFREADLWNGYPEETNAPYGVAKRLLLVQAQAYRQQYGLDAIMLFPVNLYGPRDNFDLRTSHVIPAMILKCLIARDQGAREVRLWGDGTPTREFLYVEDAAEAFAIRDLAHQVAAATGFDGELVWDAAQPNGQPRRRLDVTRAREHFGFAAKVPFAEGLRRTVAWAREARARGAL
ncbi:MAG: GDP-L-fucose synthase [Deltaproteobacteria bacterium]|nr:MAG: GDP-L-fucose synthase [Deltaproteobacteria bacterium]